MSNPETIADFKSLLDSRGNFNYSWMFPLANDWANDRNSINEDNGLDILWSWDCGLKLDFDGQLLSISSRFYPPHKVSAEYGKYSGTVSLYFMANSIATKEFEADTLDELANNVEEFVSTFVKRLETLILNSLETIF